jgi:4-hydroxythreonine-4-phosphate dehydrogenase
MSTSRQPALPLALSIGDPAGIGPDITLQVWRAREKNSLVPFLVFGDVEALRDRASLLGLDVAIAVVETPGEALGIFDRALPVRAVPCEAAVEPGRPDARNGPAIISSIEIATDAVATGAASALVTNPIAKSVLYAAGFRHPGHTEFLAELAGRYAPGHAWQSVMMLAADELRVVPLTIHVPLSTVPASITHALIADTARILHHALIQDFGIERPRLAVAGLNPHAGENGTMGTEDRDVIAPAVAALAAEGIDISGPFSADTMFHAAARARYDAAIAMYHDQALIPLKTLAFDSGVNVTLGLPFVRTSPDHGTAFDIAGSGKASPASLLAAMQMAARMASHRQSARGDTAERLRAGA